MGQTAYQRERWNMKALYATDGFEWSEDAAGLLAAIADPDRVEVTVISVTPAGIPTLQAAPLMLDPIESRRKDTIALVDHWVEWFRSRGFKATGRTGEGRPGEEIVRAVEKDMFGVTVVGSGRTSWLDEKLLGSTSSHVLHSSPTSVLLVRDVRAAGPTPQVLVAADGSKSSEAAALTARGLLKPGVAHVRVVSYFGGAIPMAAMGGPPIEPPAGEMHEAAKKAAEDAARQVGAGFEADGFATETDAVWGRPVEQILKETKSAPTDLVVMGSRGLGPVGRTLLGSVSDQVARHAPATLVGRLTE